MNKADYNEEDFNLIKNAIMEGIKDRGCPFENSEKPKYSGDDADFSMLRGYVECLCD